MRYTVIFNMKAAKPVKVNFIADDVEEARARNAGKKEIRTRDYLKKYAEQCNGNYQLTWRY